MSHQPSPPEPTDIIKSSEDNMLFPQHVWNWRSLYSDSCEVGSFRLMPGADYLKREVEFRPMVPILLKDSKLAKYLERELNEFWVELKEEGGVSLRLGPNQPLGPVAGRIAFVYKLLLKKSDSEYYETKQTNKQDVCKT